MANNAFGILHSTTVVADWTPLTVIVVAGLMGICGGVALATWWCRWVLRWAPVLPPFPDVPAARARAIAQLARTAPFAPVLPASAPHATWDETTEPSTVPTPIARRMGWTA